MKLHILISVNKGRQFLLCLMVEKEKKNILLTYCWLKFVRKELFILFFTRYFCSCLGDVLMLHLLFTTVANDVMNNRNAVLVEVLPSKYFTAVQVHCLVVSMLYHLRQHVKLWATHCKIY